MSRNTAIFLAMALTACLPPETTSSDPNEPAQPAQPDQPGQPDHPDPPATVCAEAPGLSATDTIAAEDEADVFEIPACGEALLVVELTNAPAVATPVDLRLTITDADGRELDELTDFDGEDGTTRLTTTVYLETEGSYFITVVDWSGDDHDDTTYTLTAMLEPVPDGDAEPNGNTRNADRLKSIATPIESGVGTQAYIAAKYDVDVFAITVDGESSVDVLLDNDGVVATPVDLEFEILDTDAETVLADETDFDGEDGTTRLWTARYLPEAGTYYLLVRDWGRDDYDAAQPYTVTVTVFDDPDEDVEPNGNTRNPDALAAMATPLASGERFEGFIATERDVDVYAITTPGEMLLEVELDSGDVVRTPVDLEMAILDTDADQQIGDETDFDGEDGVTYLREVRYLPAAGTYFIRVNDWGSDDFDYDQPYGIRATLRPVPDGDAEPNGNTNNPSLLASIATPIARGAPTRGFIASESDQDCYAITARTGGVLSVFLDNEIVATVVDYEVALIAAGTRTELDSETDFDGTDGRTVIDVAWSVNAGDYLVCVIDWGRDDYDDDGYVLTVTAP